MDADTRQLGADQEPLVLDALEPDQLVELKHHYGRRRLGAGTRVVMWGLRLYVLLTLVTVAVRAAQALGGR
ncbi:MAG: hypothetical protein ACYDAY_07900 [Candidatus Dormibacteria bacterium]